MKLSTMMRQAAAPDLKQAVDKLYDHLYNHGLSLVVVSGHQGGSAKNLTLESSKGEKIVTKRDLLEMLSK